MTTRPASQIRVIRAGERFQTSLDWLNSRHSFSFGPHYDPGNTHFGLLVVSNDDVVGPRAGFETHPHRDIEIVTWVLSGSLVHQDSAGNDGVIYPGLAQRTSAGTGILHSEKNDRPQLDGSPEPVEPVRFVQMWVIPDEQGGQPDYEQLDIGAQLATGDLVTVATGIPGRLCAAATRIRQRAAALHVARLPAGRTADLPDAPYVHVYVPRGTVDLEQVAPLGPGDAARVTGSDGRRLTATEDAEVLVWEMHDAL